MQLQVKNIKNKKFFLIIFFHKNILIKGVKNAFKMSLTVWFVRQIENKLLSVGVMSDISMISLALIVINVHSNAFLVNFLLRTVSSAEEIA